MTDDVLTEAEQDLIKRHIGFYRSLMSGKRAAETPAQQHFIDAFYGRVVPSTEHELAFIKFARIEKANRAEEWERKASEKSEREARAEDEPGMRRYPSRLDQVFENAKWTSKDDYR